MFAQLLEIKARRERRLRQQLTNEAMRHQENHQKLQIVIAQRQQLQQEWRTAGSLLLHGGQARTDLSRFRQRLARFHLEDRQLEEHCKDLRKEIDILQDNRPRLEEQIRRTGIEQEKLKHIAENIE
jgi:phage shock protein A